MKLNKKHETGTTLVYVCRLFVENASMRIGGCLLFLFFSSSYPQCAAAPVCKSARAYGCGFVNYDSMLWNEGSGASSFFAEP